MSADRGAAFLGGHLHRRIVMEDSGRELLRQRLALLEAETGATGSEGSEPRWRPASNSATYGPTAVLGRHEPRRHAPAIGTSTAPSTTATPVGRVPGGDSKNRQLAAACPLCSTLRTQVGHLTRSEK